MHGPLPVATPCSPTPLYCFCSFTHDKLDALHLPVEGPAAVPCAAAYLLFFLGLISPPPTNSIPSASLQAEGQQDKEASK
jgi:hypothetical protein